MIKVTKNMVKEMKMIQALNLKQKLHIFRCINIFLAGDMKVTSVAVGNNVAFKDCAPFTRCVTHINEERFDTTKDFDITIPMYNLIECRDNYSDASGSLWQFERSEPSTNNAGSSTNVAINNSSSSKYKSSILGKSTTADGNDRLFKNVKIVVPLKHLSNFWRSLEMPFIIYKIHLELNWTKFCNIWQ